MTTKQAQLTRATTTYLLCAAAARRPFWVIVCVRVLTCAYACVCVYLSVRAACFYIFDFLAFIWFAHCNTMLFCYLLTFLSVGVAYENRVITFLFCIKFILHAHTLSHTHRRCKFDLFCTHSKQYHRAAWISKCWTALESFQTLERLTFGIFGFKIYGHTYDPQEHFHISIRWPISGGGRPITLLQL